jgi:hypothetical protein
MITVVMSMTVGVSCGAVRLCKADICAVEYSLLAMRLGSEEDGQLVLLYADQRHQRERHVEDPPLSVNGDWKLRMPMPEEHRKNRCINKHCSARWSGVLLTSLLVLLSCLIWET